MMQKNENRSQNQQPKQPFTIWRSLLWMVIIWIAIYYGMQMFNTNSVITLAYSEFKRLLENDQIEEITVKGEKITGKLSSARKIATKVGTDSLSSNTFSTVLPSFGDSDLPDLLEKHDVVINTESTEESWLSVFLTAWFPFLILIAIFLLVRWRMQKQIGGFGGGLFNFGQSKAKRFQKTESSTTFDDVAGSGNAKRDLQEIVAYLQEPEQFVKLGARIPKGVLLTGPPGTGKTLLARATAGEAHVPFFSISGSEFIEMFVGVGASRVRDLFAKAKQEAPAIIFIDEIDSIGRARGAGLGGGHDEREQTLNQILSEMDGFSERESVVVMAATNRPDVLDPALLRPGRFDRQIVTERPHKKAREEILAIHSKKVQMSRDVDLGSLAARTIGFSGADLRNLVNEAALLAGRNKKQQVEMEDFERAKDKILLGDRREDLMDDEEKKIVAYHEAGHALIAKLLAHSDPLQKVTIIPHGRALGITEQIPEKERRNISRNYLLDRIAVMLGGRMAEKLVFGDMTTGAANDLKQATQLVSKMVCNWGMSEKLGPVFYRKGEEHPFLGRELSRDGAGRDFSEHTARLIDGEVRKILTDIEEKIEKLQRSNREKLDALAEALLENESLDKDEIDRIVMPNASVK